MIMTITKKKTLLMALMLAATSLNVNAKKVIPPFVYHSENTVTGKAPLKWLNPEQLPVIRRLPNPLAWANGKGEVKNFADWANRRDEISQMIQHYEIGEKPTVDKSCINPYMIGDTLFVDVTVNTHTIRLKSFILYPKVGKAPYALMIGTSHLSLPKQLFEGRPIATMEFNEAQVNNYSQFGKPAGRGNYAFDRLYPDLKDNGAYSEWAWGLSRLIDGLQMLGTGKTKIDMKHIGLTGCSYAGKMTLFCSAFDERIALTIAQEPGGGGAAAWRVSQTKDGVENIDKTDYNWFKQSMKTSFGGDNVYKLPYDHHELLAMICPRALLVLGNTNYKWLSDESAYVSINAAKKVWTKFGIADRIGYSIRGGHPHCQLPKEQYPEVEAFIDKFLLDKKDVNTSNIGIAPMFKDKVSLTEW